MTKMVGAAGLSRLRRDARAGADAEQDVALGEGLTETIEDFRAGQFKHGVLLLFEYYLFLAEHMRSRHARELERTRPMKPGEGAAAPQQADDDGMAADPARRGAREGKAEARRPAFPVMLFLHEVDKFLSCGDSELIVVYVRVHLDDLGLRGVDLVLKRLEERRVLFGGRRTAGPRRRSSTRP